MRQRNWINRRFARSFIASLAAAALPIASASAADAYKVDPVHSSVIFRIKHMNVSYFYGRFNQISGSFSIDPADPAASKVEVEIRAASIDTANNDRDKHLKSAEFFDVETHPTIKFASKTFRKVGESRFEVEGDLTLRGVTKKITVQLEWVGSGAGMRGETRAGVEAVFTIKRTEFGMDASLNGLSDDVRLMIGIEGVKR
jgi:polyisoprenoid-binding protein YceI